jgi:hypothetical protein
MPAKIVIQNSGTPAVVRWYASSTTILASSTHARASGAIN